MLSVSIRPVASLNTIKLCQPRKYQKPSNISAKRLNFSSQFDRKLSFPSAHRIKNQNLMKGFERVGASISDEGFKAFDQELLVEGSLNVVEAGGFEATLNNLSKWIVAVAFASIVLLRHDPEALWAVSGNVLNTILSVVLKKILNQERPVSTLRPDPGMPSSHAQSIFYTFVFLLWSLVGSYGVSGVTTTLGGLLFIVSTYLTWLRVSQKLHTVSQVIVGAFVGSIFSIFWFWSWNKFVFNLFMSSLWARAVVILGAVMLSLFFFHHAFRSWIMGER